MIPFRRLILISLLALPGIGRLTSKLRASEETALAHGVLVVRASVQEAPPRITLEWPRAGGSGGFAVFRKTAEANSWGGAYANLTDANATRFADDKVVAGVGYEYKVETVGVLPNAGSRQPGGTKASGVLYSGIALPPVDRRGRIILLVDETMAAPLAGELERLEQDLAGDGWTVLRHDVTRQATVGGNATIAEVEAIKAVIRRDYNDDPGNTKAVLLFGRVAIPYSGWLIPDGHDFQAREADTYYAVPDETWTDERDYGGKGLRGNQAGDDKFDQSWFQPTKVKLAVGRVDMSGLPIFKIPEVELLRRYLNKHHAFRHRHTAFAASGDTGSGLVGSKTGFYLETLFSRGMVNAVQGQLSGEIGAPRLWSYAEGLAYANNRLGLFYSANSPGYVFAGCWGSGSINYDDEAGKMGMGRPYLAGSGACIAWVCGQPNRYFHWMAMGETIGGSERLAMANGALYPTGANGNMANAIFRCLLGDPTLRMHILAPPGGLTLADGTLSWDASPDRGSDGFRGYHVYRAAGRRGPFTRLTDAPVQGTSWIDPAPPAGAVYQVRAIRLETSPTGSYHNNSQGIFVERGAIGIVPGALWVVAPDAGAATFRVKLSSKPASNVTVSARRASGDASISVQSGGTLTFTPTDWNKWQAVTVAAAHDADEGATNNGSAAVALSAPGLTDVTVGVVKEDRAIVVNSEILRVPENTAASFQVRLSGPPADDVTVTANRTGVYATGENIAIESGGSLAFTRGNWNQWQTVTVKYADGKVIPAQHNLRSIYAGFSLSAPGFRGAKVHVSGVERHAYLATTVAPANSGTASPASPETVVQGEAAPITAKPSAGYRFAGWSMGSKDGGVIVANPASPDTTATVFNWAGGLSGKVVANFVPEGEPSAPLITTEKDCQLVTVPEGGTAAFKVRLTAKPAADVTVKVSRERVWDPDISIQAGATLAFTPANWNVWQPVTLAAADDDDRVAGVAWIALNGTGLLTSHLCAVEQEKQIPLTAFAGAGGAAVTPAGDSTVVRGAPVPIAAHAAEGYRFDQWVAVEGTPVIADPRAAATTVTLSAAASIRAVFIRVENGPPAR